MKNKIRILGIAPYQGLVGLMNQYARHYTDIELTAMCGAMEAGVELALKYHQDYDVIISRANTARLISRAVTTPVIDIGMGYYDVLRCIKMVESSKTKFAIVGFRTLTSIADDICELLKLPIEVFSISTAKEGCQLLDQLKEQGYKTVICDTVPYNYAKQIGITPVLLTSSVESLKAAVKNAKHVWKSNQRLFSSLTMMKHLLNTSSNSFLVLRTDGVCLYSTLLPENEDLITRQLLDELPRSRNEKKRSFFITVNDLMYSVLSEFCEDGVEDYVIFSIQQSKIPISYSKYGISILNEKSAQKSFSDSFYSRTELAREIIADTETLSDSTSSLMIAGEIGTGKDRVAHIYYAKSCLQSNPLYEVNCSLLNDKSWNFLVNHYNSPFTDNGNTIYISNLDALGRSRQKQLLSIILDTNLHVRNRLIFSCTHTWGTPLPHIAQEYTNALGCLLIPIIPLRYQEKDIASSAALYIDALNQSLGSQVVGLDDEAAKLLCGYQFPYNRTQLKRILKKAVLKTDTAYITGNTIRNILIEESHLFPDPKLSLPEEYENLYASADNQAEKYSPDKSSLHLQIDLNHSLDDINRQIIQQTVKLCGNNRTAAAKKLGISRTTLWRYLNR